MLRLGLGFSNALDYAAKMESTDPRIYQDALAEQRLAIEEVRSGILKLRVVAARLAVIGAAGAASQVIAYGGEASKLLKLTEGYPDKIFEPQNVLEVWTPQANKADLQHHAVLMALKTFIDGL